MIYNKYYIIYRCITISVLVIIKKTEFNHLKCINVYVVQTVLDAKRT